MSDTVIAVGLLSARDLERLGAGFTRAFPVDEVPCFGELLVAIDNADREMWRARDQECLHVRHGAGRGRE